MCILTEVIVKTGGVDKHSISADVLSRWATQTTRWGRGVHAPGDSLRKSKINWQSFSSANTRRYCVTFISSQRDDQTPRRVC